MRFDCPPASSPDGGRLEWFEGLQVGAVDARRWKCCPLHDAKASSAGASTSAEGYETMEQGADGQARPAIEHHACERYPRP
jgi:hypothetical protein